MENKKLKETNHIFSNIGSAPDFISELVEFLEEMYENFSTHSMNESALFLQGQKDMLDQIITFLKRELPE
jgi:hypothetical protein